MTTHALSKNQQLTYAALGIALVFICTAFINIRLPLPGNGGLIHLGNVPLLVFAILYGPWLGALIGGVGMALFDIVGGWFLWAPFTLVIVAIMGYIIGVICSQQLTVTKYILAVISACLIKAVGYYLAEGIIYSNWILPFSSIPGNLVQVITASIIAFPLVKKLKNR